MGDDASVALETARSLAVYVGAFWAAVAVVWVREPGDGIAYGAERRRAICARALFNQFVVLPPLLAAGMWALRARGGPGPGWWTPPLLAVLADATFYACHRAVHAPAAFARVHAVHHEISRAYAPAAMYCSAAEMALVNAPAVLVPAIALRLQPGSAALCAWLAFVAADVVVAHSRVSTRHFSHHVARDDTFGSSLGLVDALARTTSRCPARLAWVWRGGGRKTV